MFVAMRNLFGIRCLAVVVALLLAFGATAQNSRYYIKKSIEAWDTCRTVAISNYSGNAAITGHNSVAMQDLPEELSTLLKELNKSKSYIDDVQVTDDGMWIVLHGDGDISHSTLPESLESALCRFRDRGERITSVSFNDDGVWIIASERHVLASERRITEWLTAGFKEYGKLWSTCVTRRSIVAVYERGYRYLGDIPEDLKRALGRSRLNIYRLKIIDDAWFFADKQGNYRYDM